MSGHLTIDIMGGCQLIRHLLNTWAIFHFDDSYYIHPPENGGLNVVFRVGADGPVYEILRRIIYLFMVAYRSGGGRSSFGHII